jgi:hypothetical protein
VDGANIPIVHYVDHGYLEEEKSMIHSFAVTFGAKYLTGMVHKRKWFLTRIKSLQKNFHPSTNICENKM